MAYASITMNKQKIGFMRDDSNLQLAVLIDADNAQPSVIKELFEEVAKFGEIAVKRIYGDFTSSRSTSWGGVLNTYAISPIQQFAYTTGKNATDCTMIIDAMDLLYTNRLDGFCIVSSDSDFTKLAIRIREQGLKVYGFGEHKTPKSFRNACHQFIFTENLRPAKESANKVESKVEAKIETNVKEVLRNQKARPKNSLPKEKSSSLDKIPLDLFKKAIEAADDDTGWAQIGTFGSYLNKFKSDFDPRTYGYKKLSDLIKDNMDVFNIKYCKKSETSTKQLYLKLKNKL